MQLHILIHYIAFALNKGWSIAKTIWNGSLNYKKLRTEQVISTNTSLEAAFHYAFSWLPSPLNFKGEYKCIEVKVLCYDFSLLACLVVGDRETRI